MTEIKNIDIGINDFELPFVVEKDNEYYIKLNEILQKYELFIKNHKNQSIAELYNDVHGLKEKIVGAIDCYYNGELINALETINGIVKKLKSSEICVRTVEECYAFKGAAISPPTIYKEQYREEYTYARDFSPLIFYKARIGREQYGIKDLLHIPFDNRGIIKNQRFSINGLPCLYLASTTYGTWVEMGRPAESEFQVSAFKLPKDLLVLDLTIQQHLINGMGSIASDDEIKKALYYLKMFPLVIAISGVVRDKSRTFKSEYIIPQLLMMSCNSEKIQSIAYLSKQSKDLKGYPQAVNLAVMTKKGTSEKYWDRIEELDVTKPTFYSDFLMRPKEYISPNDYKAFVNAIFYDSNLNSIELANDEVIYTETSFSQFDEYLARLTFYNAKHYI